MATARTRFARLGDDGDKVANVGLFQHARQIACGPKFVATGTDALDSPEGIAAGWCWKLAAHGFVLHDGMTRLKNELFTSVV